MNSSAASVVFQNETTWSSRAIGIFLDRYGSSYSGDSVTGNNSILVKRVKAVIGDEIIAGKHEGLHAAQGFAHTDPSSGVQFTPLAAVGSRPKADVFRSVL
jgi:hypothetical protein